MRRNPFVGAALVVGFVAVGVLGVRSQGCTVEWRYFGGDKAFTRYSAADQINRDNVKNLHIVWRRPATNDSFKQAFPDLRANAYLRSTPLTIKEAAAEHVRGFDARSGKLLWTFHVVPQAGEFGTDTWGNESWKVAGDIGAWNPMSADEQLGYVYIPLTAPTASAFGGWRPGANLYSDSLVALDAKTGRRVWHFQMIHHDLWEYDNGNR